MTDISNDEWVTVKEAAEALGVSERTIHRYTYKKTLKSYQLIKNGNKRILWSSVETLIKNAENKIEQGCEKKQQNRKEKV